MVMRFKADWPGRKARPVINRPSKQSFCFCFLKYNVEATEADLDAKIEEMVSQSGMKKDEIAKFYKSNENIKRNLMYAIREEKTFTALQKDMKVS